MIDKDKHQIRKVRESTKATLQANHVQIEGDRDLKRRIQQATMFEDKITKALPIIQSSSPRALSKGLQEWNYEDQLILYRGKVYVPKDLELR